MAVCVGDLLNAARTPRDVGGQKHKLHGVLAALPPEDAEDLREILRSDRSATNWTALASVMTDRGFRHSVSTWQRWGEEARREPDRF